MTAAIRRPYCTGPSAPAGAEGPGPLPAPAFPLDQLMLGHRDRGFGQARDLAGLHPGDRPPGQACPAPSAAARLVPQLPVRPGHLGQRAALMPALPARLAAGFLPQPPRPPRRARPPRQAVGRWPGRPPGRASA